MCCGVDLCLAILAFFFPPVAVCAKTGCCSPDSLINILLCILGWLPGVIHAWYIIAKNPDPEHYDRSDPDVEGGRVSYYYVDQGPNGGSRLSNQSTRRNGQTEYGTVGESHNHSAPTYHQQQQGQGNLIEVGPVVDHVRAGSDAGPSNQEDVLPPPPSYQESVRGDHKVQLP